MSEAQGGPEFPFLVRCCRWNFAKGDTAARPEVPPDFSWTRFISLARRHRVQGLAWNALAEQADLLPDNARDALSSEARSTAATNLAIAAECCGLKQDFEVAGVPLLFVKGLTIGALVYRSPMLKMGWDIDLLIDPGDLEVVARLLSERGYRLQLPSDLSKLAAWHRQSKESVWHRDGSLYVELHTRLADNPFLIPTIDVNSARQWVQVAPGASLPTLAEDELLAYLAVHGASSAWFRLKWISDFGALLAGMSSMQIERLYRRSQELGAARAAGQGLLLADALFDALERVPDLRAQLAEDWSIRLLAAIALQTMMAIEEPTERPFGTFAIHRTQLLLKPGIGFKLSELRTQGLSLLNRLRR